MTGFGKKTAILFIALASLVPSASGQSQRPPAPGPKPDETFVDFTAASELLKDIVRQIATPYVDETSPNPLAHILIAPREIRVRASFQLSRQAGRPSFIIVKPTESSMITLEVEASFDIATGSLRVSEAKRILTGRKEEK